MESLCDEGEIIKEDEQDEESQTHLAEFDKLMDNCDENTLDSRAESSYYSAQIANSFNAESPAHTMHIQDFHQGTYY